MSSKSHRVEEKYPELYKRKKKKTCKRSSEHKERRRPEYKGRLNHFIPFSFATEKLYKPLRISFSKTVQRTQGTEDLKYLLSCERNFYTRKGHSDNGADKEHIDSEEKPVKTKNKRMASRQRVLGEPRSKDYVHEPCATMTNPCKKRRRERSERHILKFLFRINSPFFFTVHQSRLLMCEPPESFLAVSRKNNGIANTGSLE